MNYNMAVYVEDILLQRMKLCVDSILARWCDCDSKNSRSKTIVSSENRSYDHSLIYFHLNFHRSQSSLDSANGFAVVQSESLPKDIEQKSMREFRNDVNVSGASLLLSWYEHRTLLIIEDARKIIRFPLRTMHLRPSTLSSENRAKLRWSGLERIFVDLSRTVQILYSIN